MLLFLKNIVQLVLSPSKGWEDISASLEQPDILLKRGYYPLLILASLSEFIRLIYHEEIGVITLFEHAIALFGSYFISYFIGRLILEHYLKPMIDGEVNHTKTGIFTIYGLGLLVLIEIIANFIPTDLTIIRFLPVFVALILYRSNRYLTIKQECELRFLCLLITSIIVVPLSFFCILKLIIA